MSLLGKTIRVANANPGPVREALLPLIKAALKEAKGDKMPKELLEKFKAKDKKAGAGPDKSGRNWTEKQNPHRWIWGKDRNAPAFTVLERPGPGGPIYKLQMLLPDGEMYKTLGDKTDPKTWFARAADLYFQYTQTVFFDLSSTPERWSKMAAEKWTEIELPGKKFTYRFRKNDLWRKNEKGPNPDIQTQASLDIEYKNPKAGWVKVKNLGTRTKVFEKGTGKTEGK